MKNSILSISSILIAAGLIFSSCKKSDPSPSSNSNGTSTTTTTSQAQQADDQARTDDAVNGVSDDVNGVSSQKSSMGGRLESATLPCDVVISTGSDTLTTTITYTSNCSGAKYNRSGSVSFTLVPAATGLKWRNAGSVMIVTYNNVTFTRNSDGKAITLNGVLKYLNSTGGTAFSAALIQGGNGIQVAHKIYGQLAITYSDTSASAIAIWNINKLRIWSTAIATNGLTYSIQGDSTYNGIGSVSDIGINRRGKPFYISNSGVSVNNCGSVTSPSYLSLGTVTTYFLSGILTVKYGAIGISGALATSPCGGTGVYYSWVSLGGVTSFTAYTPY